MAQGVVTKIYQIKTLGVPELSKDLDNIAKKYEAIKKAKQSIEGKIISTQDTGELKKYTDELLTLKIEEQQLRTQRQQMINEQKAAQIIRQVEINSEKERRKTLQDSSGWYGRLATDIRELGAAIKSVKNIGDPVTFRGQNLQYDQAIQKLKQLSTEEQNFRRQFARDSLLVGEYTSGIVQAFKSMGLGDLVGGQITKAQERLSELNGDFDRLQLELKETRAAGQSTDTIEKQMIENRNEVIQLDTQLARLKTDLRGVGDVGNQINTSLSNGFKSLKGQLGSFALQFIGIQALVNKLQSGLSDAKLSSDLTTDLQIQLGATADEADKLNNSLKALNTRTTLAGLQEIANTALKAGVAKENIAAVTEAIDKTKVAFGKDFGSVEQGTETFAKLINIFFEDGQITGDRILRIGNAIRALANETVASVPFLTDFSGRMAGVKQISNISLPDILGLGAGFEEFKQSAEVASTTLVKLIPRLGKDLEKFAEIAGLATEEFKNLLTENPAEALIKVAEGLVKGKGDVEEFAKSLADAGLDAGRVTTIVATLGGKADIFRDRIARAGTTIQETGAITDAFQKKNTNLAASMDKLNKVFSDFFASKTFQATLLVITGIFTFLLGNLPIIIGLVGLLTVSWAAQNLALIGLRAQLILYNLGIGANLVLMGALRIANFAYTASMFVLNGAVAAVTAGLRVFGITATAVGGPLKILLTIGALIGGAFLGLGKALGKATSELEKQNAASRLHIQLARESSTEIAKEMGLLDKLFRAATTMKNGYTAMIDARKDLIRQFPEYFGNINAEKDGVDKLTIAYNKAAVAIRAKAYANASAKLAADAQAQVDQVTATELILQAGFDTRKKGLIEISKLTEEQTDLLTKNFTAQERILARAAGGVKIREADFAAVKASLEKEKELRVGNAEIYDKLAERYNKQVKEQIESGVSGGVKGPAGRTIDAIQADIKDANEAFGKLVIGSKDFIELKAKIAGLEKELALADPKKTTTVDRGSRLTGDQKDAFKDIDAIRDEQLANEHRRHLEESQLRDLTETDEINHLQKLLAINQQAIASKLSVIRGANAEERRLIADLKLDRITQEQQTNDKVFEIRKEALKNQLDDEIKNIQERDRLVQEDPTISSTGKAQSKLDADKEILQLQINFNNAIDSLEKQLSQQSVKNSKEGADALRKAREQIRQDDRAYIEALYKDANDAADIDDDKIKIKASQDVLALLQSKKSSIEIAREIEAIRSKAARELAANDLARQKIELTLYEAGKKGKLKTEKEYQDALAKYLDDQAKRVEETVNKELSVYEKFAKSIKDFVKGFGESVLGIKKYTQDQKDAGDDVADALAESYAAVDQTINETFQNYFDNQTAQVEREKDANIERLNIQEQQVLSTAQTEGEKSSIQHQFELKRQALEKKAGEEKKKIALKELAINFAIAVIKSIAQYGLPLALIPIAAATALYFTQRANVQKQTFEKGGEVPTRGGEFGGRSHSRGGTPFVYKNRHFEAEAKEVAIINKKSSQDPKVRTITGSNKQILSKINELQGGVRFAPGAKIKLFESGGYLGQSLQPPVFNSFSSSSNGISESKIDELIKAHKESIAETKALKEETAKRIDRIQTTVSEREITNAQDKRAKQTAIGSL